MTAVKVMELAITGYRSTRLQVLQVLKRRGGATVSDLARELSLSGVSLRRHLDLLERHRLVATRVQGGRRGRPARVYHLTEEAECFFPQRYSQFAVSLLQAVQEAFGPRALEKLLSRQTNNLIQQIKPRLAGKSLKARVEALADLMTEMGFLARSEQLTRGQFLLTQCHCPLARVVAVCPVICDQELRMHADLLQAQVTRCCFIREGGDACRYLIEDHPSSRSRCRSR